MTEAESLNNSQSIAAHSFTGGGEMGARIREHDWTQTPLGAVDGWQQSLKTVVRMMLNSRFPMFVWWGAELTKFYNDAYIPVLGAKHPAALGISAREVWAEIWDVLGPQAETVLREGRATWNDEVLLVMQRNDFTEETYFTWSYSPIADDNGQVNGIFCACTEETAKVIGRRRLKTLQDLGERALTEARTVPQAVRATARVLTQNPLDVAFALCYLLEADGKTARLAAQVRLDSDANAAPSTVELGTASDVWEFSRAATEGRGWLKTNLAAHFGPLTAGAWADDTTRQAFIVPLAHAGEQSAPVGFLVVGLSPRLRFDEEYQGFVQLVGGHLATALANAHALEAETARAAKLTALDRAKTEFFSNVSHEFRTPLTLMLGHLEEVLGQNGKVPAETRARLQTAHRNSLRLLKLVNNLLDFSRLEAGRANPHFEPTDLARLTADLASSFRSAIETAGLEFKVECPPLADAVLVDREMWEKIVLNLISNAFKFTFEGRIAISLHETPDAIELRVTDSGVGIPADQLTEIFKRFHRVRQTPSRTYEGTGIGLSLVQEFAKAHGGTVTVESRQQAADSRQQAADSRQAAGRDEASRTETGSRQSSQAEHGTTFIVTLPKKSALLTAKAGALPVTVAQANSTRPAKTFTPRVEVFLDEITALAADTATPVAPEVTRANGPAFAQSPPLDAITSVSASKATDNTRPKILLADDNADMRGYVHRLLTTAGYDVVAVSDGQAALDWLQTLTPPAALPDLVLSDVMMPRLDGFELLEKLRADERWRTLPIILLSARAGEESRVEGLEAGADDYLVKPFSTRELLARVRTNLTMAQLRQATRTAQEHLEQVLTDISESFVILDRHWRFVYVNNAGVRMSPDKLSREDFTGRTFAELFPEAWVTPFADALRQVMRERVPRRIDYFYPLWGRWFENRIYPTDDGGISFFTADVTAAKETEEQIKLANDRFSIAEQAANGFLYDWQPATNIVTRSRNFSQVLGYAEGEIAETVAGWHSLWHPDDLARINAATARGDYDTLNESMIEYRVRHKNGHYVHLLDHAKVFRDGNGVAQRVVGMTLDISARKEAEAVLQRYRLLSEKANDIVWVVRPDGTFLEVNDAAVKTYGYTRQELLRMNLRDLRAPETRSSLTAHLTQAASGGIIFETFHVRKDGTRFPVEVNANSADFGGERLIMAIVRDITERRQATADQQFWLEISETLRHADDAEQLLAYVVQRVGDYLALSRVFFVELDASGATAQVYQDFYAPHLRPIGAKIVLSRFSPDSIALLEAGKTLVNEDTQHNPRTAEFYEKGYQPLGMNAFVGVPLLREGRWTAGLAVVQETPRSWTPRELNLLETVAERAWLTVEKLRQETALRRAALFDAFYLRLADTLRPLADPAAIQAAASRILGETLRANRVLYFEVRGADYFVTDDYTDGANVVSLASGYPMASFGAKLLANYEAGRVALAADVAAAAELSESEKAAFATIQIGAYIGVPLVKNGVLVGGLAAHSATPRQWTPDDIALTRETAERTWAAVERARAEQALREREAQLREAQRIGSFGSWHWDAASDATAGSDELLRIYGFDPDAGETMPVFNDQKGWLYPLESWERINAGVTRALATGTGYEMDVPAFRKDGTPIWITTRSEVVRDATGQIVGLRGTVQDITKRKQAEEGLRQSTAILETINQSSPTLIYLKDRESHIVSANPATLAVIGQPWAEIVGQPAYTPHETEATAIAENDRRIIEMGATETFEEEFSINGVTHTFLSTKSPYRDAEGAISGLVGVSFDITARKQQEELLRNRENFISGILGSITDAFAALDKDWRFAFANEHWLQRLNKDRAELIGNNIWELFPEAVGGVAYEQLHRAMQKRESVEFEVFVEAWQCWFHATAYPMPDGGLAIYSVDITEKKQAAVALRQKDELLRQITNITPTMLAHCSRDLRYLFINQTIADFMGRAASEIIGQPIERIMGAEAFATIRPYVERVLQGERVEYEAEVNYLTAGRRFMHVVYVPERNANNIVVGWFATITDITARQ